MHLRYTVAKQRSTKASPSRQTHTKAPEKGLGAMSREYFESFRDKFHRTPEAGAPLPDARQLNVTQRRMLVLAVVAALLAGIWLVKSFFSVIALSLLLSVIFHPIYERLNRRLQRPGTSAMLTLVIALLIIIIPATLIVIITVGQVQQLITQLSHLSASFSLSEVTQNVVDYINKVLSSITGGAYQISVEQLRQEIAKVGSQLASLFLSLLTSSFTSIANLVTEFILFMYLFTSLLAYGDKLKSMFRALNPLGDEVSALYLSRTGQMARGVVGGQFVIAACQGFVEAGILYLAGLHYFFFFAVVLTFLSVIPLGGGILAIPIGILQLFLGNIWQGLLILLGHFFVITNIDNVLRPRLVPKSIRMNSALMMLAVFGGIAAFGFLGLAIGPIIMILVISTLQVYLPLAQSAKAERSAATESPADS